MEFEFLDWLDPRLSRHPQVATGVGDDAAVLNSTPGRRWVWTTDTLTEGVDFRLAVDCPQRIGRKALAVNLSDLAAMAARPVAALITLVLPRQGALELARELTTGILDLAREFDLAVAGGDTNTWDGDLVIGATLLGETTPRGPLLRSGGRPGDVVLATGRFGGSRLGHQFDFTPRVREALWLHEHYELHAGIDVSDGLSLDLWRLAQASGCGAELDLPHVPIAPAAYLDNDTTPAATSPLAHALGDGEDFELLLAVAPTEARRMLAEPPRDVELWAVGRLIETPGLWQVTAEGQRCELPRRGFQHLAAGESTA